MLIDCASDEPYCVDELMTDWLPKGEQIAQIRRGCAKEANTQPCISGSTDRLKFKDCLYTCTGSKCNNDLTVGDKFEGSYKESKCLACRYVEHDDGTVEGLNIHLKSFVFL